MVAIYYTRTFRKLARKLPPYQQKKLAVCIERLSEDPFHTTLHTKALAGKLAGLYAFRITRDWRVVFRFVSANELQLVDLAHRRDIYR